MPSPLPKNGASGRAALDPPRTAWERELVGQGQPKLPSRDRGGLAAGALGSSKKGSLSDT